MADRTWMYSGWQRGRSPSNEWIENTKLFLDHAFSIVGVAEDNTVKCPCPCR
jgi:beta-xylosidase